MIGPLLLLMMCLFQPIMMVSHCINASLFGFGGCRHGVDGPQQNGPQPPFSSHGHAHQRWPRPRRTRGWWGPRRTYGHGECGLLLCCSSLNMISRPKCWSCCLGDDLLRRLPQRGAAVQRTGHQLTWRSVRPDCFDVSFLIFDPHSRLFSCNQRWPRPA